MKRKTREKLVKWAALGSTMLDRERAEYAAQRTRRYIDSWELLKAHDDWLSSVDLAELLGISRRLARRTLDHLEAAGLVELKRGSPPMWPTLARVRRTGAQEREKRQAKAST